MGYDYELVTALAVDKGLTLKVDIAPSLSRAIEMLDSGKVDLIAYEVPITAEYKEKVVACGPENITTQVLVQPKRGEEELITDVTGLVGKDVYVEAESKYEARMNNLNQELGGGIRIHPVNRDTMITEDLIAMVSEGKIPLTVVDSDIAHINKTYYNDLDINTQLSFEQRSGWAVAPRPQMAWRQYRCVAQHRQAPLRTGPSAQTLLRVEQKRTGQWFCIVGRTCLSV